MALTRTMETQLLLIETLNYFNQCYELGIEVGHLVGAKYLIFLCVFRLFEL